MAAITCSVSTGDITPSRAIRELPNVSFRPHHDTRTVLVRRISGDTALRISDEHERFSDTIGPSESRHLGANLRRATLHPAPRTTGGPAGEQCGNLPTVRLIADEPADAQEDTGETTSGQSREPQAEPMQSHQRPAARPVVFVDIDGVLNPTPRHRAPRSWPDWQRHRLPGANISVWASTHLVAEITRLPAEIVWATSWINHPTELTWYEHHLGLYHPLPRVRLDPQAPHRPGDTGKRTGIISYLADEARPVVWIDDEHGPADRAWARQRNDVGAPTLLLATVPGRGLEPNHLQRIRAFLAQS